MTYYPLTRRKVYGTEQLADNLELLTTTEYAARYSYTRDAIVKKCRKKQLTAFKQAGVWYIVTAKAT